MLRLVAQVTGNLDALKTVGRGLVIGLAAIGPGVGLPPSGLGPFQLALDLLAAFVEERAHTR